MPIGQIKAKFVHGLRRQDSELEDRPSAASRAEWVLVDISLRLLRLLSPEPRLGVDEDGLPVVDYGRRFGTMIGRKRNPTTIAIVGLKAINSASLVGLPEFDKTGDEILSLVSVERMARWLFDSSVDRKEYMVFHIGFRFPSYFLVPPWKSCLSEGFGGMFLVTYGTANLNRRYVECGIEHLRSLLVPVSEGGLRSNDSGCFLECSGYDARKRWPIILNGHLYCLVTLFNAWKMLGIPEFGVAFKQAVSQLEILLPTFEGPFFSYYDDYGNPAKLFYHRVHIHLLKKLFEFSNASYLRATAERWEAMLPKYNFTLALLMRVYTMRIPYLPRR